MRRTIDSVLLLIICFISSSSASYTIYYKNSESGKYYIEYNYPDIVERVLWTDGFSNQYNESLHSFNAGYSMKSYAYIRDNAYPNTVIYSGNVIEKRIGSITTKSVMKEKPDIIMDMSCPLGSIIYINNSLDKLIYNVTKDKYIKVNNREGEVAFIDNIALSIFGNEFYPDSIHWSHYRFIKNKSNYNVVNPFRMKSKNLSKEYFKQKQIQKKLRIGNIIGEISMNGKERHIAVILPFDLRSDRYGNTYSDKPYTTYQLAQRINGAVFIFDFLGLKTLTYDEMKKQIAMIEEYFSTYYDDVTFIAFNDMCPMVIEATENAFIIAINPPLCTYNNYEAIMYAKLNKNSDFIYSSLYSFRQYNVFHNAYFSANFIDEYNNTERLKILVSYDVLDVAEIQGLKDIQGKYTKISNIDRRLNSYIIEQDLFSYKRVPIISESIIKYLNKQL